MKQSTIYDVRIIIDDGVSYINMKSNSKENLYAADSEYKKLIDICISYGLNSEETNQLINEFKQGAMLTNQEEMDVSLSCLGQTHQEITFQ